MRWGEWRDVDDYEQWYYEGWHDNRHETPELIAAMHVEEVEAAMSEPPEQPPETQEECHE